MRLLCPWDSLGKNTGVGCHFLLEGIFLTQGLNPESAALVGGFFTTSPTREAPSLKYTGKPFSRAFKGLTLFHSYRGKNLSYNVITRTKDFCTQNFVITKHAPLLLPLKCFAETLQGAWDFVAGEGGPAVSSLALQ